MPEITYELTASAEEIGAPIQMQVISYDAEGENLEGVTVHLELLEDNGSFDENTAVRRQEVVTDPHGKAYFVWRAWPPDRTQGDLVSPIRASWEGREPFVFIERFREQ